MNTPLLPLADFVASQPLVWYASKDPAVFVVHDTHVRWKIQREISNSETGTGYMRREALLKQNVVASEVDSKEFAQSIVRAFEEHLTPRNLKDLAEAFATAVRDCENERAAYIEALQAQTGESSTR